jgi:hypothetical protein
MLVSHWMGDQKFILELLRASEGTLSRRDRLHLQSLAPTNPHCPSGGLWFVLLMCNLKEGLCPISGDINRLMMMVNKNLVGTYSKNNSNYSLVHCRL